LIELLETYGNMPIGTLGYKIRRDSCYYFIVIANSGLGTYSLSNDIEVRIINSGTLTLEIRDE